MHAHFRGHVYHRHSHETYSLGVTESGAQGFTCRGAGHVSTTGLVMAFNPDDPHDGHAATGNGFTYRMIHMAPDLLTDLFADLTGAANSGMAGGAPVIADPGLAGAVRRLHQSLTGPAGQGPPGRAQPQLPLIVTRRQAEAAAERAVGGEPAAACDLG